MFKEYFTKLERVLDSVRLLLHVTTPYNAVSALESGLMSKNNAIKSGIKFQERGYDNEWHSSKYPDAVSFFYGLHNPKRSHLYSSLSLRNSPTIVVDGKYQKNTIECKSGHPIYYGIIPAEDILAIVQPIKTIDIVDTQNIFYCSDALMELQRDLLSPEKFTPIFQVRHEIQDSNPAYDGLFVPKWIEIPREIKAKVKCIP